ISMFCDQCTIKILRIFSERCRILFDRLTDEHAQVQLNLAGRSRYMFEIAGQEYRAGIDRHNGGLPPGGLPERERGHPRFVEEIGPRNDNKIRFLDFPHRYSDFAISPSRAERVLRSFAGSKKNTGPRQS